MPQTNPTDHSANPFQGNASVAGAGTFYKITPSNSDDLPVVVRAVRVNSDGVIALMPLNPVGDQTIVNYPCKAGEIIIGYVKRVKVENTTVTGDIIGLT